MCGRTACSLCEDSIVKASAYKSTKSNDVVVPEWRELNADQFKSMAYKPSYNQSPGQSLPVMIARKQIDKNCCDDCDHRIISGMKWGLIPDWHKEDINQFKLNTNNCRVETIKQKRTYSASLNKGQRCVVLVEGFFEWKTNKDNSKEPYFFYFPQKYVDFKNRDWIKSEQDLDSESGWKGPRLLTMAGLYNCKKCEESDEKLYTFTVITVPSHPSLQWIHSRMPAILDSEDDIRDWLDFENVGVDQAIKLLVPIDNLEWHPVSSAVSNSRNNSIDNVLPIKVDKKQQKISDFFKPNHRFVRMK